ncbi:MAG: hypothetical protein MUF54_11950, partial [Polyangiaceae bacterium]|nr:hypothetical protein [Polyangiaceae bacterium]
ECPRDMPLQLYSIITKALQPEPSDRFESAREFSTALQDFVGDHSSEASAVDGVGASASAAEHGHKPRRAPDADLSAAPSSRQLATAGASRRSRRAAVAVAVGIAALVAGAAVAIVKRSRDPAVVVPVASRALPATAPRLTSGSAPAVSSTALPVESSPAPGVVQVVVGARHSCAVLREGTLRCWGANEAGQLGDGTTVPRSRGVQPTGLTDAVSVVLGDAHSCGLTRRGEVWCWGANASGQLGDGASSDRLSPTRIQTLKDVERVHAFACGAFARLRDGSVYGWGCNEGGQMGSNAAEDWLLPKQIPALHGAVALTSVGTSDEGATCAIRAGGVPHCWSWGLEQLRPRLPAFANLERVTDVVLGTGHGCLLLEAGTARCWGDNSSGEVGDGTLQSRAEAVAVPHVQELEQLVVGERHTCGRTRGGEVYCWGGNARGQLGHAAQANRPEPRLVPGVIGARQLLAAGDATCALLDSGRVTCWGDRGVPGSAARGPSVLGGAENIELLVGEPNRVLCMHARADGLLCMGDDEHGQLGRGRVAETSTPVQVAGLDAVERIAAAARNACAIRADGALHCWGSNAWRAFGNKDGKHTSPVQVDKGALDVTVGARGLYALVTGAGGKSKPRMGGALLRDLGAGRFDDIAYPRPVRGLDSVRQVAMGAYHACALLQDGNVACWGDNTYGQVGDGTAQHRTKPTRVPNFEGIVELATGGFHTCARRDNGTVACWGNNTDGQVGTGPGMRCRASGKSYSCVREPRRVVGVAKATSLAAGQWHTCVLRENGTAMCWGANAMGQLGDGTTISRAMPAPVLHLSAVRQLAAAEQHTCAALEDGSLRCWGTGARGELGAGPMSTCGQRHVPCAKAPIPVEGIRDAVQVAAGWEFSCALTRDKHVWCWGNNQRGTLGDGSVVRGDHPEPVTW